MGGNQTQTNETEINQQALQSGVSNPKKPSRGATASVASRHMAECRADILTPVLPGASPLPDAKRPTLLKARRMGPGFPTALAWEFQCWHFIAVLENRVCRQQPEVGLESAQIFIPR